MKINLNDQLVVLEKLKQFKKNLRKKYQQVEFRKSKTSKSREFIKYARPLTVSESRNCNPNNIQFNPNSARVQYYTS